MAYTLLSFANATASLTESTVKAICIVGDASIPVKTIRESFDLSRSTIAKGKSRTTPVLKIAMIKTKLKIGKTVIRKSLYQELLILFSSYQKASFSAFSI